MRAYNSKMIPKEHILFFKKHKKLSFTKWHINFNNRKIPIHAKIFIVKREKYIIFCSNPYSFDYYNSIKKIAKGIGFYSISQSIKIFEKIHNVKIENLGLTRDDFSANLKNLTKITKKLDEYKNNN